nr:hypothetical protein [Thiomicrorhabdus sp.]
MISIYTDRALSVIKKYNSIFAIGGTGFTLDVYEDDRVLTYDGTGATPGTYAVTYTSTDVVIGSIGPLNGSCSVTSVSQVINLDLENTTVLFTITGTDTLGNTFVREYRYTYLVITDGAAGGIFTTIWRGEYAIAPSNPIEGWLYRNTTDGTVYMFVATSWIVIATDGISGAPGSSLNYLGAFSSFPITPEENDTFRHTVDGIVYIFASSSWAPLTYDGDPGVDGLQGIDGKTLYITYNDSPTTVGPSTPTGDGNTGGWGYTPTAASNWMSQKISSSISLGTWSSPILMTGLDGINGDSGIDGERGAAWFNGSVDAAIDSVDDVANDAEWIVQADILYNNWSKVKVDGDLLTLSYSVVDGDGWAEVRRYDSSLDAWVGAGTYIDGDLLVEGSIWTNGNIQSGAFEWIDGSFPQGFFLSGKGYCDPTTPGSCYNIVGGNIYGGSLTGGSITGGSITGTDTLHVGNTTNYIDWDGSALSIAGSVTIGSGSGSTIDWSTIYGIDIPNDNADVTITEVSNDLTIASGGVTMANGGSIKSSNYNLSTNSGIFYGYSGGQYQLMAGNGSQYLRWNGSSLDISGNITGSSITGSSLEATNSAGTPPLLGSGRSTSIISTGSQIGATGYGSDFGVVGKTTNTLQNTSGLYGDGGRSGAIGVGG